MTRMTKMTKTKEEVTEVRSALTTKKRPSEGWTIFAHASKAHHPCDHPCDHQVPCQDHGEKKKMMMMRRHTYEVQRRRRA